jgi:hypothetical protein
MNPSDQMRHPIATTAAQRVPMFVVAASDSAQLRLSEIFAVQATTKRLA